MKICSTLCYSIDLAYIPALHLVCVNLRTRTSHVLVEVVGRPSQACDVVCTVSALNIYGYSINLAYMPALHLVCVNLRTRTSWLALPASNVTRRVGAHMLVRVTAQQRVGHSPRAGAR